MTDCCPIKDGILIIKIHSGGRDEEDMFVAG